MPLAVTTPDGDSPDLIDRALGTLVDLPYSSFLHHGTLFDVMGLTTALAVGLMGKGKFAYLGAVTLAALPELVGLWNSVDLPVPGTIHLHGPDEVFPSAARFYATSVLKDALVVSIPYFLGKGVHAFRSRRSP